MEVKSRSLRVAIEVVDCVLDPVGVVPVFVFSAYFRLESRFHIRNTASLGLHLPYTVTDEDKIFTHRCDQADLTNFAVTWHHDAGVQLLQPFERPDPVHAAGV